MSDSSGIESCESSSYNNTVGILVGGGDTSNSSGIVTITDNNVPIVGDEHNNSTTSANYSAECTKLSTKSTAAHALLEPSDALSTDEMNSSVANTNSSSNSKKATVKLTTCSSSNRKTSGSNSNNNNNCSGVRVGRVTTTRAPVGSSRASKSPVKRRSVPATSSKVGKPDAK